MVRQGRANHLIEVFGITTRFETNQTGLPEPTTLPKPPSSLHTTLHISFARVWAELSIEKRRLVVDCWNRSKTEDVVVQEFITAVLQKTCESGRGDVYNDRLEKDIEDLFPSFFDVLREALALDGKDGSDVAAYEHDFGENKVALKIAYELKAQGVDS